MASLFDTGACERLRRGERSAEEFALRFYPPVICTHVAAELFYGWLWTRISAEDLLAGREFVESFETLTPNISTASIYGRLRASARHAGKQMPDPDYWIAAHAIENRLPLVSTDSHFEFFEELDLHLLD